MRDNNSAKDEKKQVLASALRTNLRRRKRSHTHAKPQTETTTTTQPAPKESL